MLSVIRGTVYVLDLQSSVAGIQVFVAGFEAQYNIANAGAASVSGSERNRLANSSLQATRICSDIELDANETYIQDIASSPDQILCAHPVPGPWKDGVCIASFPGLPFFCSSVCVQYNTQKQKSSEKRRRPGST